MSSAANPNTAPVVASLPNGKTAARNFLMAIVALTIGALAMTAAPATAQQITPAEARAIAKEATIYGFPLVDSYRVQYSYFVDRGSDQIQGAVEHAEQHRAGLHAGRHGDPDAEFRYALFRSSAPTLGPSRSCSPCRRSTRTATTPSSSSTCTPSTSPMSAAGRPATTQAPSSSPGRTGMAKRRPASRRSSGRRPNSPSSSTGPSFSVPTTSTTSRKSRLDTRSSRCRNSSASRRPLPRPPSSS